jgi:hypothetical protein
MRFQLYALSLCSTASIRPVGPLMPTTFSRARNTLNNWSGEAVHMPMCNKDVADAQELARSKPAEAAEIEKRRSNTRST